LEIRRSSSPLFLLERGLKEKRFHNNAVLKAGYSIIVIVIASKVFEGHDVVPS